MRAPFRYAILIASGLAIGYWIGELPLEWALGIAFVLVAVGYFYAGMSFERVRLLRTLQQARKAKP